MPERGAPLASPPGADVVRRHRRLVRRTALLSGLTLLSRLLGFVREVISAALFGDRSGVFDAFITAWRIPNLFRRFLGEGAIATALVTSMTEVEAREGEEAGRRLLWSVLRAVAAILVALALAVMAVAWCLPEQMPLTGWAWLGPDAAAVKELTVRLTPFVVFVCLTAIAGGALQVRGRFAEAALGPVLLNVVWILALVGLGLSYGWSRAGGAPPAARQLEMVRWLAWGVLAGGLLQLCMFWPALRAQGLLPPPRQTSARPRERGAKEVLRRSAPLAFGAAVYQINVMIDGLMAEGLLPDGAPTLHYYANRVQQFPLALVSIAATSAVFPALSALGQTGDLPGLRRLFDRTQRSVAFLALPASAGLIALATPIVAVCFERGAFGPEGVARTAAALRWLAIALLPAGAAGLCVRTYYAVGEYRHPVRISAVLLAVNAGLNVLFVSALGMDINGLALATALTAWAQLAWLLPGLTRRLGPPEGERPLPALFLARLPAALATGLVAAGVHRMLDGPLHRALALLAAIAAGGAAFLLVARLLRSPEIESLLRRE